MEHITSQFTIPDKSYSNALTALSSSWFTKSIPLSSMCFFDIETTGLSADISSLYLIGTMHYIDGQFVTNQWFADDYISEASILNAFTDYLESFQCLIHYNGTGFDIPYLSKKYEAHQLSSPFQNIISLDLYKILRPYKSIFPLPNMKLTSLETFIHCERADSLSGKECISVYTQFIHAKYFREDTLKEQYRQLLLLHNHDDILGTFLLSQMLFYLIPLHESSIQYSENENKTITYHFPVDGYLPHPFQIKNDFCHLRFYATQIQVQLVPLSETRYHFYNLYKEYYYLPLEDTAIHKSVGIYVDSEHREKATKKNCYTKKTGLFLPLFKAKQKDETLDTVPIFWDLAKKKPYILVDTTLPSSYYQQLFLAF